MKVLITGASGFIGGAFLKITPLKYIVRAERNKKNCGEWNENRSKYFINKLNGYTGWDNALTGIEVVIHLAGLAHCKDFATDQYQSVNVEGTLNLARSAIKKGVRRFIFVSSIGVNGQLTKEHAFFPEMNPSPYNDYSRSKLEAEIGLKRISEETGLEVVIIRPTLVYGPNAPGNFGMLTKLIEILPFLPFRLTNNKRSFISVDNLVDLIQECVTNPNAAGHIFLASEGSPVSTREFTNAIAKGLGKKVVQLPVPPVLFKWVLSVIGKRAMYDQLFGNLEVDASDLKEVLNWSPPYTMEESMAKLSSESSNK